MYRNTLQLSLALLAVVGFVACGGGDPTPEPAAPAAAPTSGNGSIQGTVTYVNGDPDTEIAMDADPVCKGMHQDSKVHTESMVATDGKLANVFAYVKNAPAGNYPKGAPALLNQEGCQYKPHVSGVMVGQELVIKNSDPTLHNVHALPTKNKEFNQGQPFKDMELKKTFDQPEVMVRFKCDVHPWMSSYMAVLEHPFFAVTDESGAFTISGLPGGDYDVELWHETLGTRTVQVSVPADGAATVEVDLSPAA